MLDADVVKYMQQFKKLLYGFKCVLGVNIIFKRPIILYILSRDIFNIP